jgi:hypothetical protein
MDTQEINKTLSYCLYICDEDILKYELYNIQRLFIAGFIRKIDVKRLQEIEEELQNNLRDK